MRAAAKAYGGIGLLLALALAGCAQTSNAEPSTTIAPLPIPAQSTSTTLFVPPPEVTGYGQGIIDGRTFQLSVGRETRVVTMSHIVVPAPGTCEGDSARNMLGSLIIGHQVRLGNDEIVWRDDLDVARTLVQFGMAKAADGKYADSDSASVDFNCANTTTTAPVVAVAAPPVQEPQQPRPKTTTKPKPKPKRTTLPPETTPEEPDEPVETDPPQTDPPATQPAATPPQPDPEPPETPPPREERHHGKPAKPPKNTKKP